MLYSTVLAFSYIGIRSIMGADMSYDTIKSINQSNFIEWLDASMVSIGLTLSIYTPIFGLGALLTYISDKPSKKYIRGLDNKIRQVKEDYNFSKGFD